MDVIFKIEYVVMHKKWRFILKISSVNVNNFVVSFGFGHIYWKNVNGKLHFLCRITHKDVNWKYIRRSEDILDVQVNPVSREYSEKPVETLGLNLVLQDAFKQFSRLKCTYSRRKEKRKIIFFKVNIVQ